uniref:arylamine N-acetyltransferase n=1 Tax=Scylla olivacea TaxID=85551 RepID=A0A0P4W7X9_SCYOL
MCSIIPPPALAGQQPDVTKDEAQSFITEVLKEELPQHYPPSILWINKIIQAFHRRLPFQNITFLSKTGSCCVPSWKDIQREILIEGKGGLCLSLNVAFAAVMRTFGVHTHLVPADYVATNGRSVHALTVFHLCAAVSQSACKCFEVQTRASTQGLRSCRRSSRLKQKARNEAQYCLQKVRPHHRSSLYVADVGCGFPTLRAINLNEDIDKAFLDCGLEYCFTKKRQKYLRLHRTGDEVPKGEER